MDGCAAVTPNKGLAPNDQPRRGAKTQRSLTLPNPAAPPLSSRPAYPLARMSRKLPSRDESPRKISVYPQRAQDTAVNFLFCKSKNREYFPAVRISSVSNWL